MSAFTKACIAAALAAMPYVAQADIIAYTDNNAGGRIEFSDVECSTHKGWNSAMVIDSDGTASMIGCWQYFDPNVVTEWPGVGTRYYDVRGITLTEAGRNSK